MAAVPAPLAPAVEDPVYGPLQRAAKVLEDRLARDERWVVLGETLTAATSSDYVLPPNPAWAPFHKARTIHLPDRLFEEYDLTESRCSMGLLTEIERAWVSVDHRLFLWDWADGTEFSTFEELPDVIVGVGLVTPRPGVFLDSISHVLVLATPGLVTLVGLGFVTAPAVPGATTSSKRELTFFMTGLSCPTDGIALTTITGTKDGRIFLGSSPVALTPGGIGGDGCLYELNYQSAEGWFSKRCSLTNLTSGSLITKAVVPSFLRSLSAVPVKEWVVSLAVDNERGLLYTLLRNGTVEMFQITSTTSGKTWDGALNKVATARDILRQAMVICPGSPMLDLRSFEIVALETIAVKEGGIGKVGLVAITSTGVRLYFTHQRRGYTYYAASTQPSALELCHVRPPPSPAAALPPVVNQYYGQAVQAAQQLPAATIAFSNITNAIYSAGGLLVAANNVSDELDVMLVTAPDIGRVARAVAEGAASNNGGNVLRPFSEVAATINIEGRTWGMSEITRSSAGLAGMVGLNELATQVILPRREWVVLTNMGANVIVRQRPLDTLLGVLEGGSLGGGGNGEVGIFFESYGRDQSCAMLLTIAAGNSRLTVEENSSSNGNGGNRFAGNTRNATSSVTEQAKSLFFEGGGRPISIDRGGSYGGGQKSGPEEIRVLYSGRHEGLAFYFARLVRPIWRNKITVVVPTLENLNRQVPNVSEAVLSNVQRDLTSLRAFVEQEHQLFSHLPEGRSSQTDPAYLAEQNSIASLRVLLVQSVEAISFILLLIDYRISNIIASCSPELQSTFLSLTYQELLTSKKGRDTARGLVSVIINQQIGLQLSVDAISDILQQRCGSFCSADDVLLYKAIEAMRRAKDTTDSTHRTDSLRESLRLFIKAAKHLSLDKLKDVCAEYNSMRYPLGVIDLALACAKEWDASDRAVSFWLDGSPASDARAPAYDLRMGCYDLVFATLKASDDLLNEATSGKAVSYEEADGLRTNAYNKALTVKDEFFHISLYDWYISRGMTDQLLETRTPYLESYLKREPATLAKYDLLWQYYVRISRYANAATILAELAEADVFPLTLHKRVEYLSLAVSNAKSQLPSTTSSSAVGVEFLTEVEEKLEVAMVQIEIYRAIEESVRIGEGENGPEERRAALEKLEERLFTISELYSEFAAPLEMLEVILLIFHVSGHRDPAMVNATWDAILARADDEPAERRLETISSKIVDLGRRFQSSDIAFPLPHLATMLERYSWENRNEVDVRAGWVPLAFRDAGAPWESVFVVFDELFTNKVSPFHTTAALAFLATNLTVLLSSWLDESSHASNYSGYIFPATEVDNAVGKYLMMLNTLGGEGGDAGRKLIEVQREIRRRF